MFNCLIFEKTLYISLFTAGKVLAWPIKKILRLSPISPEPGYLTTPSFNFSSSKEFELLYLLATHPGRVYKREEIMEKIWGNDVVVGGRTIDVHIRKLREKIGEDRFQTIKGVGYKFVE